MSLSANQDIRTLSRQEKLALLERRARQKARAGRTFPLSFPQQRLWFLDRIDPGSPANDIFRALRLRGLLDVAALSRALSEIVRRHEALRTTFPSVDDEPRQRVAPAGALPLPLVDLAPLPAAERRSHLLALAAREAQHSFDLTADPLFRATLVRLGETEHALFLTLHHIVADGWSMSLLFSELSALYRAFAAGLPSPLPEPRLQYPDFAVWQRERMTDERVAAELGWWREQMTDLATLLELPTDRPRPAVESFRGDVTPLALPAAVEAGLRALARGERATLFMVLLAAFEVLLYRTTGQEGFLVGTNVAGRDREETEDAIGFFANTLLLPARPGAGSPGFRGLLEQVVASTLDAYEHQELPFERLVEALQPERQLSYNPLFQVVFVLQNLPEEVVQLPGVTSEEIEVPRDLAKLDLTLELFERREGVAGRLEYSTALFDAGTARRLADHFLTLLGAIVADPDRGVRDLPLLSVAEREDLLFGWNPKGYELPPPVTARILAQARRTPEAFAVVMGDERLSYADLVARADRLARLLRRRGVGPDTRVGLCLERSVPLYVALLGILAAGAAYVPLDPAYPRERLALMIADTRMRLLVTESRLVASLPLEGAGLELLLLDQEQEKGTNTDPEDGDTDWEIVGEGLAYIIYTSGSTGRPKGVGVPHRALANHAGECARIYELGPADRVLQFTSLSFDITAEEVFPTWIVGGAVVPRPPGLFPAFAELEALLARHGVTVVNLPTAYWHEWASELYHLGRRPPASLRLAIVGTEQALPERLAEWLEATGVRFANSYASTECTITALVHLSGPESLSRAREGYRVPVGRPIENCRVYVLDALLEPVPIGVPGDVYIGGANVSRGYLDQPERTAASFVPDPFGTCGPGGRLYRQGDLGRFLPTGELECLGRSDDQVKIRGFRIEPGEIEAVLVRHPAVRDGAVLVRDDGPGGTADRRLVGYVAVENGQRLSPGELRAYLREALPEYMVPAGLVVLPDLPITAGGKIDRRALREIQPESEEAESAAGTETKSAVEEALAGIWAELLGRERLGVHEDFFALGGHSLLATRVLARVRGLFGVEVGIRAFFAAPTLAGLARAVEAARDATDGASLHIPRAPRAPRASRASGPAGVSLPLSFAQQRLWFFDRLQPGSTVYNLPMGYRLRGPWSPARLAAALSEIVRRHEALRTTFADTPTGPAQEIAPPALSKVSLPVVDLSGLPVERREPVALRRAGEEALRPFDLARGPLLRTRLFRLTGDDQLLVLATHHIISDGWSLGVLLQELCTLYAAPRPLPELPIQYADFALWQRERLAGPVLEGQLAYWRQRLSGQHDLELPTDRPRPPVQRFRGSMVPFALGAAASDGVRALSRHFGAPLFMTLLAAWKALLHRYTGQTDLLVGTPTAGRDREEVFGLIGFFVNLLVLRTDLAADPSFAELLGRVRETSLGAYAHGELPFERLVEELAPERSLARSPLFQVVFSFQAAPAPLPHPPGLALAEVPLAIEAAKLDLTLGVSEANPAGPTPPAGEGFAAWLEYDRDLFDRTTVLRLAGHFKTLLAGAGAAPRARLSDLPLLTAPERAALLAEWSDTARAGEPGALVHELFAAHARRQPEALAVRSGDRRLTYGELAAASRRLAHHLRTLGLGPERLAAVCAGRTLERVVAILAVLQAGGAFVSLDPDYPPERLATILGEIEAPVLLTEEAISRRLPATRSAIVLLDREIPGLPAPEAPLPASGVTAGNLAYVIYTSGSTGTPKGVAIPHAGLSNLVRWHHAVHRVGPGDAGVLVASPGFDASVWELLPMLAAGAALHIPDEEARFSSAGLLRFWAERGITLAFLPGPLAEGILEAPLPPGLDLRLRDIAVGGDRLYRRPHPDLGFRLLNMYGPAEASMISTGVLVNPDGGVPTIGRPIDNVRVYVLDRAGRPAPAGVPGELYVAGGGLARGYLGRPDLTAERFVPDPWGVRHGEPGARAYRTGDRVRFRPDGEVEFLGRLDHQVKLRGARVELGEIEAALGRHPGVREAVVLARQDGPEPGDTGDRGDRRLAAYILPGEPEPSAAELRAFLEGLLPGYMVPQDWVFLPVFPLNPHGKVDRRALPAPERQAAAAVLPRTPIEEVLAGIFCSVLALPRVGVHDNFFALGGHSLLATQVVTRVREAFGAEVPVRAVFEEPTVEGLARRVLAARSTGLPPLTRAPRGGGVGLPLSFAQQRLWFLTQYEPESPEYNIPQGFRIEGPLAPERLKRAVDAILARHEALRTTFPAVDGQPMQLVADRLLLDLPVTDLTDQPAPERHDLARRAAVADAVRPFDLTLGPLLRALLFCTGPEEHLLFLNVHHVVYDGWSGGVFATELAALYAALSADRPAPLPELPVQYLDFSIWQRGWLSGEVLAGQLDYWKGRLLGAPPLDLATDRPRPAVRTHHGGTADLVLPRALAEGLTRLGQSTGGTLYVALSAAMKALLHHYTGQEDLTLGTLIANRTLPETERMIGFFANTLALRTDLSGDPAFRTLLEREREVALGAYTHQDLPFEKLVDEINPQRDLARTPIFQAMLILQNQPGGPLVIPGLRISEVQIDNATSKFELTLYAIEREDGLAAYLEYNTDLFDPATVRRFLGHLAALAQGALADPALPLSELSWFSPEEARQLLHDWNATTVEFPRDRCLHDLITLQVARTPGAVAVELEGERVTYQDLDGQANRLARHLRRLGVGPEVLVGLAVERSFDMMVGLLGILKAGGAYVPLDPEYPRERLAYMLEQSGLRVLLTQERLLGKFPALPETGARVLVLDRDEDRAAIDAEDATPFDSGVRPENLAYILYTSGSTGKPKGVQIPHGAVVNFLLSMARRPGMTSADTLLAVTTLSFDIAGLELYLPLVQGARVVLVPRDVAQAGEQLLDRLTRSGTTVMQATPATWRLLLGAGWKGDGRLKVLCGGEALPRDLADSILAEAASLWNVYGPTEATIWSMLQEVRKGERISIGKPLDNTQVYLLSPRGRSVPVGVPGELSIGGAGLARGYRDRPDLTAERFVPDPFSQTPGARLYRTGDLARHLPDGTVEFLGRIDHQVKVRGFRIELGEIETVLAEHPGIAQTVVLAREDTPGTRRLVAYFVARTSEPPKSQELRDFLKSRLPEYMVPALFVPLETLPLTPNGKVDRRALPAPDQDRSERPYVAPSTPVELELAALWAEILGVKRVGLDDDFFELGGDSLLVIRVVSKANKKGLGITTKQLFQHRTLGELARVAGTSHVLAEQGEVEGVIPFTPAQLHFLDQRHTRPHYHSLGMILEGKTPLDPWAAREAFRAVLVHHDNLRVRLVEDEVGARLLTDPIARWEANLPFLRVRLPPLDGDAWERAFAAIKTDLIVGFDLHRGPLLRGVLIERPGEVPERTERTLVLIGHFLIADIGSWQTVLDDFDLAYRQALAGEAIQLPAKTTSARQWADRLAERAHSMDMGPEKEYWFSDARRSAPAVPLDFPQGVNTMASSLSVRIALTEEETRALLTDISRTHKVQIDAILLTSVLYAFAPWTGARKLQISLLGHGREPLYDDVDLTRTVGWLNTFYPAFLTLPEGDDLVAAVQHVNQQLRQIPNGGIGYGVLRYLSKDKDFLERVRTMPEPGLFFNYFGDDNSKELVGLTKLDGFGGYGYDGSTRRGYPLAFGVYIQQDRMILRWERSGNVHREETIQAVAERSAEVLRRLIRGFVGGHVVERKFGTFAAPPAESS